MLMKLLPAYQTLPLLFFPILLLACSNPDVPESTGCGGDSIAIAPTATRQTDPDLFSPPAPPPDGGDGADYCATPVPAATPATDAPTQFVTTEVANLSLDVSNQELAATAVGDDMLAVAWLSDGDIFVALARSGNHFQVRRVDSGSAVSLAFSRANRLRTRRQHSLPRRRSGYPSGRQHPHLCRIWL